MTSKSEKIIDLDFLGVASDDDDISEIKNKTKANNNPLSFFSYGEKINLNDQKIENSDEEDDDFLSSSPIFDTPIQLNNEKNSKNYKLALDKIDNLENELEKAKAKIKKLVEKEKSV